MVPVANPTIASKGERHVRWNWEVSPDGADVDSADLVRYHLVVVDDRDREGILARITGQLALYGALEEKRRDEGDVAGSKLKWLLVSYDSPAKPSLIDWTLVRKPRRQDQELYERTKAGCSIEKYVKSIYDPD